MTFVIFWYYLFSHQNISSMSKESLKKGSLGGSDG